MDKIIYLEPLTEDIIAETKTLGITYVSKKYFQEIFEMYSKKFNFSSHKKLSSLYEFNKQKENLKKRNLRASKVTSKNKETSKNKVRPSIKF